MADNSEKSRWAEKAAIAGAAAVGSAAITAALMFVRNRREQTPKSPPPHPEEAPETD